MTHRQRAIAYALVAISVTFATAGQLLMKSGMSALGTGGAGPLDVVARGITDVVVLLGILSYVLSSVTWLVVLSRVPLSVAYPLGSSSYVLVVLASILLGEAIPPLRWLGVSFIVIGLVLVGGDWSKRPA